MLGMRVYGIAIESYIAGLNAIHLRHVISKMLRNFLIIMEVFKLTNVSIIWSLLLLYSL